MSTIHCCIIYPRVYVIIIANIVNGFGCALLRVASLKFLTDQSTDATIVKNNTLHWGAFKSAIFFGNLITFVTIGFGLLTNWSRVTLGIILLLLGCLSAAVYCCISTEEPVPSDNKIRGPCSSSDEATSCSDKTPLIDKITDSFNLSTSFIAAPTPILEEPRSFKLKDLLNVQVLFLAYFMACCGSYDDMFGMILPTETGKQYNAIWSVSAFGMVTGVGELIGSFWVNPLIKAVGTKQASSAASILTLACFTGCALFLPLQENNDPVYSVNVYYVLAIAFLIGVCDVINSVVLSSTIATCYKDNSQVIYTLYAFILNAVSVAGLFLISYSTLFVVFMFFSSCIALGSIMFWFVKIRVQDV